MCFDSDSIPGFIFTSNRRTLREPNTSLKKNLGSHADPSVFYINLICIILSKIQLKIPQ
jgi:hypothetical protein